MKLFLLLIAVFVSVTAVAQVNIDSLRMQYKQKTMLLGVAGVSMNDMMLTKTETRNLMLLSPDATKSYQLYRKKNTAGTILPVVGFAAVVSGLILSKDSRTTGTAIVLGGSVINAVGALFRKMANHHLQQAIWSYNRDVLYPVKK